MTVKITQNWTKYEKCQGTVPSGLDKNDNIFNLGVGTYFLNLNLLLENETDVVQFPKRLTVVSSSEETALKEQREAVQIAVWSLIVSFVAILITIKTSSESKYKSFEEQLTTD